MTYDAVARKSQKVVIVDVKLPEPLHNAVTADGRQPLGSALGLKIVIHVYELFETAVCQLHNFNFEAGLRPESKRSLSGLAPEIIFCIRAMDARMSCAPSLHGHFV